MPLLTDELSSRLPPLYAQEAAEEPTVYACFFLPGTQWRWYVTEGQLQGEDFMFFGFVCGLDNEFGYFLLSELETLRTPLGTCVERDESFAPGKITDVVPARDE